MLPTTSIVPPFTLLDFTLKGPAQEALAYSIVESAAETWLNAHDVPTTYAQDADLVHHCMQALLAGIDTLGLKGCEHIAFDWEHELVEA